MNDETWPMRLRRMLSAGDRLALKVGASPLGELFPAVVAKFEDPENGDKDCNEIGRELKDISDGFYWTVQMLISTCVEHPNRETAEGLRNHAQWLYTRMEKLRAEHGANPEVFEC